MKKGTLFIIIAIPVAILLTGLFIQKAKDKSAQYSQILDRKKEMQKVSQITRKGYFLETRSDEVCAERIIRKDGTRLPALYCSGVQGIGAPRQYVPFPDSAGYDSIFARMIREVDSLAHAKGFTEIRSR